MNGIAFCPAHVTGFFKAEFQDQLKDSKELGSLGAGFSMQDGVVTRVKIRPAEKFDFDVVTVGYQPDNTQVSEFVIKEFCKIAKIDKVSISVKHEISVPVGYGLGCSGAVALSLALALDQTLETNFPKEKIGQIAHHAELSCKTGLGDVLASYHGGFEIRTKSGAPGIGKIEKIDTKSNVIIICFAPISTKKFIDEKLATINGLGGKMVSKLIESRNCNDFQDMSLEFAKYIKVMTPRMESVINDLQNNGIKCGVALFGETIFSLVPEEMEDKVTNILSKYKDGIIIRSKIDNFGARIQ